MTKHYDIIINGSGIVGLVIASSLANTPLKIAVLDKSQPSALTNDIDQRVYAITRASQQIFQQLGIWSETIVHRASPYLKMNVWDTTGDGDIHFDCRDIGEPNLGHIIENSVIQQALLEKIKRLPNIEMICPVNLVSYERHDNIIYLTTDDECRFAAPLIIGADGANSWIREQNDIQLTTWSYGHAGIIATVKSELPHEKSARQCFMPQGPLAFLPLIDAQTSSIVWSTQTEHAKQLMALSDDAFKSELATAFCYRLGDIEFVGKRLSFPLQMRHVKQYVKEGVALVGDAAHTLHPLAGQGMNLGILDAVVLARVIMDALKKQRSFSSHQVLSQYERERKTHNVGMIALMEGFKQLFSSKNSFARLMRNGGLNVTNNLTPIKRQLMWQALGGKTVEFG